jgi:hypothetical protein
MSPRFVNLVLALFAIAPAARAQTGTRIRRLPLAPALKELSKS